MTLSWTTPSENPRLKDPSVWNPGHSESVGASKCRRGRGHPPAPDEWAVGRASPKNPYCSDGKTNTVAIEKRILSYSRTRVSTGRYMGVFKENVQTCPYSVPEGWVRHPLPQYSGLNFPALWWTLIWHGFGSVKIDTGSKISSLWPFQDSYRFRKFHSPINLEYYSSPLKDGQTL